MILICSRWKAIVIRCLTSPPHNLSALEYRRRYDLARINLPTHSLIVGYQVTSRPFVSIVEQLPIIAVLYLI